MSVPGQSAGAGIRVHLAVFLLSFGSAWNACNMGAIVTPLADDLGATLGQIGLLSGTVFFIGVAASSLLGAEIGRRVPLGAGLRASCALCFVGNVLCAVSSDFTLLVAGRAIAGLGLGAALLFGGAFTRAVGGVRLLGIFGAGVTLGAGTALAVGAVIVDLDASWRLAFVVSAVAGLSALPFIPARVPSAVPRSEPSEGVWREALSSWPMWRLQILGLGSFSTPFVVGAWLVPYLVAGEDIGASLAGALGFLLFVVSAIWRDLGGRMLARGAGPGLLAWLGCALGAAGLALLAADRSFAAALAAVVLIGIGLSLPYALIYDEAERVLPERPLGGLGLILTGATTLPILVVPVIGAALASDHGGAAWLALAAFVLLSGLVNARPAVAPSARPA
ncbi:MAG: MFS transporter [Solirubrobacterales bacterium]|nr:MFS transporter [Solirubrobacterales bacterium]